MLDDLVAYRSPIAAVVTLSLIFLMIVYAQFKKKHGAVTKQDWLTGLIILGIFAVPMGLAALLILLFIGLVKTFDLFFSLFK